MLKFFYLDLKRILFRLKNILLIIAIGAMFTYSDDEFGVSVISEWLIYISWNISLISAILAAASCTSSDSLCDDMEYNYTRQIILRTGCFSYSIARVLATFISSMLVFICGYAVSTVIRMIRFGVPSADDVLDIKEQCVSFGTLYKDAIVNHGLIWYGICIGVHIAVLAGVLSLWGLLLSLYINNRMLVYLMPVAALNIFDMFLQRFLGVQNGAVFSLYASGITGLSTPRDNMSPLRYYILVFANVVLVLVLVYKKMEKKVRVNG